MAQSPAGPYQYPGTDNRYSEGYPPQGYPPQGGYAPQGYPPAGAPGGYPAGAGPAPVPPSYTYPQMPPLGPGVGSGAGPSQYQYQHPPPHKPYDMPSTNAYANPWGGGGPTGSGVIPPDVEAQVMHQFADRIVRQAFMRKVFGIVAAQLAVTVAFSFVCYFVTPIKEYVRSTPWPFYLSWGLSFGLLLAISCSERLRRRYPMNMIFLGLFTLAEAFLVGMITSFFDIEVVALAFLCTCVAVGVLALIACQSKIDVTSWGTYLLIPSVLLIVLIIVGIFWVNRIWYLVIAGVGALLASAYIVYDLQLIMGGKQYSISPDEYVFASLSLYLDIVQLFLWLLYLIGFAQSD